MFRIWAAAAIAAASLAAPAGASAFEQQVMAALNAARADPVGFADALRAYRARFDGKLVSYPDKPVRLMTNEGTVPVDEAIAFLGGQRALTPMAEAGVLARAAAAHVADQSGSGLTGHQSNDGRNPLQRIGRQGNGAVAEVIHYGSADATEVVLQLIVDDGVADRGHRRILFDPSLRFAGVACGPHATFRTMCVIDFAAETNTELAAR